MKRRGRAGAGGFTQAGLNVNIYCDNIEAIKAIRVGRLRVHGERGRRANVKYGGDAGGSRREVGIAGGRYQGGSGATVAVMVDAVSSMFLPALALVCTRSRGSNEPESERPDAGDSKRVLL